MLTTDREVSGRKQADGAKQLDFVGGDFGNSLELVLFVFHPLPHSFILTP